MTMVPDGPKSMSTRAVRVWFNHCPRSFVEAVGALCRR